MTTSPTPTTPAVRTDIVGRLLDDALTAEDRRALVRVVWAVQGAEDVADRTGSTVPGEWRYVADVVAALG